MNFQRIVVALDPSSSTTALATAVDLARATEAEIVGLFIEDADLIRLAALPLAREVGFPSAVRREFDVSAIERSFRAYASRMREDLRRRLTGETLKWTFQVVRGPFVEALATVVDERDLAIMSLSGAGVRARVPAGRVFDALRTRLFVVSRAPANAGTIVVVPSASVPAADVDEIIGVLARPHRNPVLLVVSDADATRWQSWCGEMRARLAARGMPSRIRTLGHGPRAVLDRLVAKERAPLVVTLGVPEAIEALFDTLPHTAGDCARNGRA
jgi:hypothetical protein